jgi:hypothetical protein
MSLPPSGACRTESRSGGSLPVLSAATGDSGSKQEQGAAAAASARVPHVLGTGVYNDHTAVCFCTTDSYLWCTPPQPSASANVLSHLMAGCHQQVVLAAEFLSDLLFIASFHHVLCSLVSMMARLACNASIPCRPHVGWQLVSRTAHKLS